MSQICVALLIIYLFQNSFRSNATPVPGKVTPELKQIIQEKQVADIMVSFDVPSSATLEKISMKTKAINNRAEKLTMISDALETQSLISQKGVLELLKSEKPLKSRVLWITNQLSIKEASGALIDKLTALDEVTEIDVDPSIEVFDPITNSSVSQLNNAPPRSRNSKFGQLTYGLETIKVPEVWSLGYYGQGVVIGIIDTGIDYLHDALRDTFVGTSNYGWFDPIFGDEFPFDYRGHGTHCLGSIVGHNGIGVAPGARWMGCVFNVGLATFASHVIACLQHYLCPGDKLGRNRNCSKSPRLISNSWGSPHPTGGGMENIYAAASVFQNTDTFLLFVVGNHGPSCSSCWFPGGFGDIFSVGATNFLDEVSVFSSAGYCANGTIKPEVVAPGEDVISSFLNNDYKLNSGTSMATPHVSGVVALLLSKNPNLKNEEIWNILIKSTEPVTLTDTKDQCESIPLDKYPNNRAGYGRINALTAITKVKLP